MENCYIQENKKYSYFLLILFLWFGIDIVIKKTIKKGKYFYLLRLPCPNNFNENKNKRYLKRLKKFILKNGIKNVCCGTINEDLIKVLKENCHYFKGEDILYERFLEILKVFSKKKNIKLINSKVCFISDNPEKVKRLILKCEKEVKSFSVLTKSPEIFSGIKEKMSINKGIFLEINCELKNKNVIYVNCENKNIFKKDFFVKCYLLDIYKIYNKAYYNTKITYTTTDDDFFKKNNISKNLSFTEFLLNCIRKSSGSLNLKDLHNIKNLKVYNIKNYD